MKLYYSDVLSPRKACAVAKHLNPPVKFIYLDMGKGEHRRPDYLALNPNGKVPTLTDGDHTFWEADAIMCYLSAQAGSDLWPQDARQIEIVRWLSWNQQHFSRHGTTVFFEKIIKPRFNLGDPDPGNIESALNQFRRFAAILNAQLDGCRWLLGNTLTVADFAVATVLPFADRIGLPLDEFPAIHSWHDRLSELDAWREPFPSP